MILALADAAWGTIGVIGAALIAGIAGVVVSSTKQLRPNGGTSLNDAIRRIDERTQVIDTKVDHQGATLSDLRERVARIEGAPPPPPPPS